MTRLLELDKGCRGHQVQMLQHLLNTAREVRPPLDLDGLFGSMTDRAVRRYQERRSLKVDGIVGAETWRSLGVNHSITPLFRPPAATSTTGAHGATTPSRGYPSTAGGTPSRTVPIPSTRKLAGLSAAAPGFARVPATPRRAGPIAEQPGTAIEAPWMRVALAEKWVREVMGKGSNKRIMEYHTATSLGRQPDSVPWCASFVNWCLAQVGRRGTNSAAAASFRNYGQKLTTPRYGCIIQIHRGGSGHDQSTGSSTGNHVAFFLRQTATHITLLGGNQSDQVKESSFRLSSYQIEAIRWPS